MNKRPLSQSLRQWLLDEIVLWRADGLVSEDQANAILDLYETPRQSSARHQSVAIYVLVGIAATFVGLAAFLCIGYNWQLLPDPFKVLLILGALAGAHGLGFWLRYARQAKIFSEFAFFLGCLFYGGAIALLADVFQLGEHPADGVWWWALGVIPLALCLDTLLLHLLVASLLAVWVGMEMLSFHQHDFGLFDWIPRVCFTLPLFAALGLAWAYQKRSPTTVGLYVPLVAWWLVLLPFVGHLEQNPTFFIGSVGALLLIVAEVHPVGSRFAIPYRLYGALGCMGVLSVLSFHEIQREFARIQDLVPFVAQSLLITVVSGVVFGVAFAMHYQREHASYLRPMYAFAVRQWLPLSMAALMLLMTLWYAAMHIVAAGDEWLVFVVPTVAANAGMLVLALWLMMFGLREERGFPAAGGVVFFLLWSILRYVEWFGGHGGMLGASCMFFMCGAAIFGFAMFWHQRKKQHERSSDERAGA